MRGIRADSLPTPSQQYLIRAAVLDGEQAEKAWQAWRDRQGLDDLDAASFPVLPLLYRSLQRNFGEHPHAGRLRGIYKLTWSKNQLALHALQATARQLTEAAVPVLCSRGLPLLMKQGGDTGTRPLTDLDLTIRGKDLEAAARVLSNSGWRSDQPLPERRLRPFLHRLGYSNTSDGTRLELRWRVLEPQYPPEADDSIWKASEQAGLDMIPVRFPEIRDLLILTLFHGHRSSAQDACRWVVDALTLLRSAPAATFAGLPERARTLGLWGEVRPGLDYLHAAFRCSLPPEITEELAQTVTEKDGGPNVLSQNPDTTASLGKILEDRWQLYSCVTRHRGKEPGPVGFADYLLRFYRHCWSLKSRTQVPLAGFRRWRKLHKKGE